MKRSLVLYIFLLIVSLTYSAQLDSSYSAEQFLKERFRMSTLPPAEAKDYFTEASRFFLAQQDTSNYIKSQVKLSDIAKREGHFNQSFDILFEVQALSYALDDKSAAVEVHHLLGILYGIYGFDSTALEQTKTAHSLLTTSCPNINNTRLISSYLDVAVRYIAMSDYPNALLYLDSCYIINETHQRLHYIDAYYGYVYSQLKNYPKAREYFQGLEGYFEQNKSGFLPSLYYFLAQYYGQKNNNTKAISYYEKAIDAIDDLQTYLNLKPDILEHLSELYYQNGQTLLAYLKLEASKILSDSLYNTQSQQNRTLFEVKNNYKEDLIQKEEIITAQNKLLDAKRKATFRLKLLISFLVLMVFIVGFALRIRYKMRHLAKEKHLDELKNTEILEVKNKELTANALQMVEKEQEIKELLEALKASSPERHKALSRKLKHSNKKIWSDFNLRFTQTNSVFYKKLQEQYPDLTPTDLKHCALIRLNFDSKEMSDLLGISVNSVHMARSRIRKKMGMERADSLSQYLNAI